MPRESVTANNVSMNGRGRLAVGDSRDVVMIDALGTIVEAESVHDFLFGAFAARTGWDVASEEGDYVLIRFRLQRVQAWRSLEEISGRTIMKDGVWLD